MLTIKTNYNDFRVDFTKSLQFIGQKVLVKYLKTFENSSNNSVESFLEVAF